VSDAALPGRVDWALTWSDLKDRARDQVQHFSGGMRRRLNMACSLLHGPKIVLLDEPTVGVDPQSRERIYEMLAALRQAGVSIVLTTHHLEEAEQRCDRIVIIDHGRIVAAGSLASLLQQAAGPTRRVDVRLRGAWPEGRAVPDGLVLSDDRRVVRGDVRNVAADLPVVLDAIARAGGEVDDLALRGATLHDAFIALTGRELRE
jgi:ABC-2 type transport system ATP-binding protein